MPSPSHLRRLAEQATRRADELEREARLMREQAVELRRLADLASGLHIGEKSSRLSGSMQLDTADQPKNVRIAASLTRRESNAKRLLLEAGHTDKTIAAELKSAGLKAARPSVNAWLNGRRAIPASHEKYLREKYHVPKAAWPRVGK